VAGGEHRQRRCERGDEQVTEHGMPFGVEELHES